MLRAPCAWQDMFKKFDVNADGTLDRREVELALREFEASPQRRARDIPVCDWEPGWQDPQYKIIFDAIGLDLHTIHAVLDFCVEGDGQVEYEELCQGVSTMEDAVTKRDTWAIMSKVVKIDRRMDRKLTPNGTICPLPCHQPHAAVSVVPQA
jgi:hypothetical protein